MHADRQVYWAADGLFCPITAAWSEIGVFCWSAGETVTLSEKDRFAMGIISRALVIRSRDVAPDDAAPALPLRPLSRREMQCAYWLSQGERATGVARILQLSVHTVRQYIDSAQQKLGARNRGDMILMASALGLIAAPPPEQLP